jgi:ABC-type multidrug transport system fused ATPase/permease subunit
MRVRGIPSEFCAFQIQTAGCFVSLYMISSRMTLITVLVLPAFIAVGAACGAMLRGLSRRAQAQMSLVGAIADEAFGNIRTVKAFAMEPTEIR